MDCTVQRKLNMITKLDNKQNLTRIDGFLGLANLPKDASLEDRQYAGFVNGFFLQDSIEYNQLYLSLRDKELHIGNEIGKSKIYQNESFLAFNNEMEGK